jgi:hypothetical protein
MPNNSSQAGFLVQTFPPHVADKLDSTFVLDQSILTLANSLDDDDLFDFFHDYIVGLTGLDNTLVIPRWQPEAPVIPDAVNWCAFGITDYEPDQWSAEIIKADGSYEMHRHEEVTILASFYGNNPGAYARIMRDGMQLAQNHEVLTLNNMGFVEGNKITLLPTLLKEKWLKRADFEFVIRRQVIRGFPVLPVGGTSAVVNNEAYAENVNLDAPVVLAPIEIVNFIPRLRSDLLDLTFTLNSSQLS